MKHWKLGLVRSLFVSFGANAGRFSFFQTLLQSVQSVKTSETLISENAVGMYDEVKWDESEFK